MDEFLKYALIAIGLFAFSAAALDWGFFMNSRKAQRIAKLMGRTGARVFYMGIGLAIIGIGVASVAGWLPVEGAG